MASLQEQWRRGQVGLETASGNGEQCVDVLLAGCGDCDDFAVDGLFATQLDLPQQPPDAGVEPEDGANDFFEQRERPVAAANVRHLVAGNRPLGARRHVQKLGWQQDYGIADSECHRTRDLARESDQRADAEAPLQVFKNRRERAQPFCSAAVAPQTP